MSMVVKSSLNLERIEMKFESFDFLRPIFEHFSIGQTVLVSYISASSVPINSDSEKVRAG